MARRLTARPGAEPRCRTSCEEASTWFTARNRGSTPTYDRAEAAAGIALYAGLAAVPVRAGGARLRCPWAVAGPGRASRRRAERSSRRGRLAGGPPPTGTPSSPAQQSTRGARNTSGAKATQQQADYRSRTWCLSSGFRLGLRAKVAVI